MKLSLVIASPEWDVRRREMLSRLENELRPQCEEHGAVLVIHRHQHKVCWPGAIEALELALTASDVTHVCSLPDDAILVPHFVEVLQNLVTAKPDEILDLLSNHEHAPKIHEAGADWYRTVAGSVLFGGTMRAEMWRDFLDWTGHLRETMPVDNALNAWALEQGKKIWKPLPSPTQHDLSLGSLNGNDAQDSVVRTSQCWEPGIDLRFKRWNGAALDVGRTFYGQHWNAMFACELTPELIEGVYWAARDGEYVSSKPHVFICTPAYGGADLAFLHSRDEVVRDLADHGIPATVVTTPGDSLVTRGRHVLVHEFLKSPATHMLQWDSDIQAVDPAAVRRMLETKHRVIGGAYPFRDGSGNVVVNLRIEDLARKQVDIDATGSLEVSEIGTGFLMVERSALVELCVRHPGRLYEADIHPFRGEPMWALFDTKLYPHPERPQRRRYLSEDWEFCRLWREAGGKVHCYTGAELRHWGKHGHEGSIQKALGMKFLTDAA